MKSITLILMCVLGLNTYSQKTDLKINNSIMELREEVLEVDEMILSLHSDLKTTQKNNYTAGVYLFKSAKQRTNALIWGIIGGGIATLCALEGNNEAALGVTLISFSATATLGISSNINLRKASKALRL